MRDVALDVRTNAADGRRVFALVQYNLRFAVNNTTLGKSGSVYTQMEVPNFEKDCLSMSGVAISVRNPLRAAGKDVLAGLLPVVPTTQRPFAAADRIVYKSTATLAATPEAAFPPRAPDGASGARLVSS